MKTATIKKPSHLRHSGQARSPKAGAALMMSLMCVTIVAGLGTVLLQMHSTVSRRQAFSVDRRRALYIAEAGIAEAALAVSQGKSGLIASPSQPAAFGGGVYWVETHDLPENRIALICTSQVGTAEFKLRTLIVPNLNPVASLGFFGASGVEVGWGTVADGYNSSRGTFDSQASPDDPGINTEDHLKLGSNGDIFLNESTIEASISPTSGPVATTPPLESLPEPKIGSSDPGEDRFDSRGLLLDSTILTGPLILSGSDLDLDFDLPVAEPTASLGGMGPPSGAPTRLYGDLRPGPEGTLQSNGHSEISGAVEPQRYPVLLPPVTLPEPDEILNRNIDITFDQTNIGVQIQTSVTGSIVVEPGATLSMVGPKTLVVDQLVVSPGAALLIDTSQGPVELYLRSGLALAPGSQLDCITPDVDSRGFSIFMEETPSPSGRVVLQGSGHFHGILYAPSDHVILPNTMRIMGSVVANELHIAQGARLTFDRRLSVGGDGVATLPKILAWQIVPLSGGLARRISRDPIVDLRLRGITPVPSSDGAPETRLRAQYISASGTEELFDGELADMLTRSPQEIIGVRWIDPRSGSHREWIRPAGNQAAPAVPEERRSSRNLRALVGGLLGPMTVGLLTEEESADLVIGLPDTHIAAAPRDAKRAVERIGTQAKRGGSPDADPFDLDLWLEKTKSKDGRWPRRGKK